MMTEYSCRNIVEKRGHVLSGTLTGMKVELRYHTAGSEPFFYASYNHIRQQGREEAVKDETVM